LVVERPTAYVTGLTLPGDFQTSDTRRTPPVAVNPVGELGIGRVGPAGADWAELDPSPDVFTADIT
jgi:hypothetical protein